MRSFNSMLAMVFGDNEDELLDQEGNQESV